MVDTSHVPGLGYMEIVNPATLLPIIRDHILPETTVWSDKWSAYNGIGRLPE